MLNPQEAIYRADALVSSMGNIPVGNALQVLNLAMGRMLERADSPKYQLVIEPESSVLIVGRPGGRSKIENDMDVRSFINGLKGKKTLKEIETDCVKEFGENRAPSKSAIHRYTQKLKYPNK